MLMGVATMETMPALHLREGVILSPNEAIIYDEICSAAAYNRVCPNYLDLNEACGLESSSASPSIVARLERKGLIVVKRFQRFRRVQICATGQWTARSPSQHVEHPHVPRGTRCRTPAPSERKHYKTRNRL